MLLFVKHLGQSGLGERRLFHEKTRQVATRISPEKSRIPYNVRMPLPEREGTVFQDML
jgi:hypothetical protein